jgi:hypothetical protein
MRQFLPLVGVRGKRLTVTGSSIIEASTLGAGTPGSFDVVASESVEVIGRSADNKYPSALAALVYRGAKGAGDNLRIVPPIPQSNLWKHKAG